MIRLTRLNNQPIALNSDLIKVVESAHDTVLTLVNGEKIVVRESTEEVIRRVVDFRRTVIAGLPAAYAQMSAAEANVHPADRPSELETRHHG